MRTRNFSKVKRITRRFAATMLALTALLGAKAHAEWQPGISSIEYSFARAYMNEFFESRKSQSGTISFRVPDHRAEISMPFLWMGAGKDAIDPEDQHCCKHNFLSVDLQYRQYLTGKREGLYAGLVWRGVTGNGYVNGEFSRQSNSGTGFTVGYRHLYKGFLYWNVGITAVKFNSDFDEYDRVEISSAESFRRRNSVTYDVFKIGLLIP